jgi:hypothetical protein
MDDIQKRFLEMDKTIALTLKKIEKVNSRVSEMSERVCNILNNQKHYLNNRGKNVLKRQADARKTVARFNALIKKIPKLNVTFTKKAKDGRQRILMMVTHNEARKIRALAELDFRSILNASNNFNKRKHRLKLSNDGKKGYR